MRKSMFLSVAALIAPLAAASAQPPQGREARDPARFEQRMAEHRAREAQDLAIVLALKPAQQPALEAWLASMAPPHRDHGHDGPPPAEGAAPKTTPEMLAHEQQRMAERQQRDGERIEATKRFYASLDSQQQKVFDALGRLRHGDGGMHHGMGGEHGPHGPGGDMPPPPQQGE